MSILNQPYKNIPEYYSWMYLDGYTPEQIRYAARKSMMKQYNERRAKSIEEAEINAIVEKKLQSAVDKAFDDIFKEWK